MGQPFFGEKCWIQRKSPPLKPGQINLIVFDLELTILFLEKSRFYLVFGMKGWTYFWIFKMFQCFHLCTHLLLYFEEDWSLYVDFRKWTLKQVVIHIIRVICRSLNPQGAREQIFFFMMFFCGCGLHFLFNKIKLNELLFIV